MNLLESMHHNEITKNQGACHAAISACQCWTLGVSLLKAMRQMQLQLEEAWLMRRSQATEAWLQMCNTAAAYLSSLENWALSLQTFQDLKCHTLEADDFCHSIAISTCRRNWQSSLQFLCGAGGSSANVACVNAGIAALNEAGRWQSATAMMEAFYISALQIDVITFGSLLKRSECPTWTWSLNLLQTMEQLRCEANTITLNAAINSCEEAGAWQVALHIMDQTVRIPSLITWNSCLSSCAKAEQWNTVLALMDSMVTAHFQPDIITFNAAMRAMLRHWPKALQLLRLMRRSELRPTLITYGALITCCEKGRQWQKALGLLQALKQQRLSVDVISYSACISAGEKARRSHVALELLEEMRAAKLRADGISCNAVLSSCEKSGDWHMALSVLEKTHGEVPMMSGSFNACISSLSTISAWFRALSIFSSMGKLQLQPDDISYNAAITSTSRSGQWSVALSFFDVMPSKDPVTFGATVSSCPKGRWTLPLALLKHLDELTLTSNRISHNAAVEKCRDGLMWKEVLALVKDMSSMRLLDTTTMLSTVAVMECCDKPVVAATVLGSLEQHLQQILWAPEWP
ncbi:unnamed protein product [Cladocopium goreaui]|uniref:Pentacotripeptide-repeat region of PRORP domain-containing protein n=2 Tax=Cladocopium goreaui TaxID=2562237 RepID=A0A9P1G7F3_9DINO|nr:unnamed protein product [Cladocopium goreaui]